MPITFGDGAKTYAQGIEQVLNNFVTSSGSLPRKGQLMDVSYDS
jgi:hypothetical protein